MHHIKDHSCFSFKRCISYTCIQNYSQQQNHKCISPTTASVFVLIFNFWIMVEFHHCNSYLFRSNITCLFAMKDKKALVLKSMNKIVRIEIHFSCIKHSCALMNNVPIFLFSSSKYNQDATSEGTVSFNLCFSKPPIMFPRDSVSLNWLNIESRLSLKTISCRENPFREWLGFRVIFLCGKHGLLIRPYSTQTEPLFFIASHEAPFLMRLTSVILLRVTILNHALFLCL